MKKADKKLVEEAERSTAKKNVIDLLSQLIDSEKNRPISIETILGFQKVEEAIYRKDRQGFQIEIGPHFLQDFFYSESSITECCGDSVEALTLATRTVSNLYTLPWDYTFWVSLPFTNRLEIADQRPIGELISLQRGTEVNTSLFKTTIDKKSIFGAFLSGVYSSKGRAPFGFNEEHFYLTCELQGHVRDSDESAIHQKIETLTKAFIGLGVAQKLFRFGYSKTHTHSEQYINAFRKIDSFSLEVRSADFNSSDRATLSSLELLIPIQPPVSDAFSLISLSPEEYRRRTFERQLTGLNCAFMNTPQGAILRRAGRWFFDAHSAVDKRMKFVQLTTVLEILLSQEFAVTEKNMPKERDLLGLAALMANRYAFSLGTSTDTRAEYHRTFKKIYDLRSRILHDGRETLTLEEQETLFALELLTCKVLQNEMAVASK